MKDKLIQQLKEWHVLDEHQSIVDAVLAIPEAERDYELNGLLGRAYNNLDMYTEALTVLLPLREQGEADPIWNYRVGYSYYYLDKEEMAREYFVRASELDPEDEDAREFIEWCDEIIEQSSAAFTFIERTDKFWKWFARNEEKLSDMVENNSEYDADEIVEFVSRGTNIISEDIHFNIGGDHELTFAVENHEHLFYVLPWLASRLPAQFCGKWKIHPYMQSTGGKSFGFGMHNARIDTADIQVSAKYNENANNFDIRFYEKNLCDLKENECYSAFGIILKITIGEGLTRIYINSDEKAEEFEDDMIPLVELENHMIDVIKTAGREIMSRPDERYSVYKLTPEEGPLRYDVISGASCFTRLIAEYYRGEDETVNALAALGAQAMFISYPAGQEGLPLRHEIEDRLESEILGVRGSGSEIGILLGGAAGNENMYIDLLLYDKLAFEMKARDLLAKYEKTFLLCSFRPNGSKLKMTESRQTEDNNET